MILSICVIKYKPNEKVYVQIALQCPKKFLGWGYSTKTQEELKTLAMNEM